MTEKQVPVGSKCAECRGAAQLGVTSSGGKVLLYCRPCAKRLARELNLPALAAQLAEGEKR